MSLSDRAAYDRGYYAANRERIKKRNLARYRKTRSQRLRSMRAWRTANADSFRAGMKAWRKRNAAHIKQRRAAYRRANRLKIFEQRRAERKRNRLAILARITRRRVRRLGNGVEPYRREVIYERDRGICHLCRKPVTRSRFQIDHLTPISKGGPDSERNVAIAHPRCNASRGARDL